MRIYKQNLTGLVGVGLAITMLMVGCGTSSKKITSKETEPASLMKVITKPTVMTKELGGVHPPSKDTLEKMHRSQYILHAKDNKLTQIPVKKVLLPHAQPMNPQAGTSVDLDSKGNVYVRQDKTLCQSTDGGKTWKAKEITSPSGYSISQTGRWKVLDNGSFICVAVKTGKDERGPAEVWSSQDEGQSWNSIAKINIDMTMPGSEETYDERYVHRGLDRLKDDTLLWMIDVRSDADPKTELPRNHGLFQFRSDDGGQSWEGPLLVWDWGSEGAVTTLPSGNHLATLRYQRDRNPQDSPETIKYMGAYPKTPDKLGFKNVFLMDSTDGGVSWTRPRMLTTVYGQTYGSPLSQSDGTVVVIHDTRYGPGGPGSRALISRDEGKTWQDEVYYLDATNFTGSYSASVVFDDDTILTIAASSVAYSWEQVKDKTDLYAIRWKPVKE